MSIPTSTIAISEPYYFNQRGYVRTYAWNGSSWTEVNDVSKAAYGRNGSGSTTAGLVFGGHPDLSATEEFTGAGPATVTITVS